MAGPRAAPKFRVGHNVPVVVILVFFLNGYIVALMIFGFAGLLHYRSALNR